jgi:hypothetical protein
MDISAPSGSITPDSATPVSMGDAPPPIGLKHRDPDYYKAPLVILVSLVVVLRDAIIRLSY